MNIRLKSLVFIFSIISVQGFSLDIKTNFETFYSTGLNKNLNIWTQNLKVDREYKYSELKSYIKNSSKNLFILIEPRIRFEDFTESSDFHTDQFYIKLSKNPVEIKLGKQRIGTGCGYLWNVVNNIDKPKDVFIPTKYTIGTEGINLSYSSSKIFKKGLTEIDFAYSSEDKIYGANIYNILENNLETGLVLNYKKNDFTSFGLYSSYDFKGVVMGMEVANFYNKTNKKDYWQYVFNLNKNFSDDLFLLAEYLYNQKGASEGEFKNLLISGNFPSLASGYIFKKYSYLLLNYKIDDDLNFSTSSLINLQTKGGFIYPALKYSKIKNLDISLEYINNFTGNKIDEFYLSPYKDYFILRLEYFF